MEFDLVENALHSYSESLKYYLEVNSKNTDKYKFCILLMAHSAELLLKEILRKEHPILIFEDIDNVKLDDTDPQIVNFRTSLQRVKKYVKLILSIMKLLRILRNTVQHYKCEINEISCKCLITVVA